MTSLPVIYTGGTIAVVDPDTGQLHALPDAPAQLVARVEEHVAAVAQEARSAKAALDDELRRRMGPERRLDVGTHLVEKNVKREWDADATWEALVELVERGLVTAAEAQDAMPEVTVRKPDGRRLNALLTRIVGDDPVAAQALARARSSSEWVKVSRAAVDTTATEVAA